MYNLVHVFCFFFVNNKTKSRLSRLWNIDEFNDEKDLVNKNHNKAEYLQARLLLVIPNREHL